MTAASSDVDSASPSDSTVPRPMRDLQTVRHIVCRPVISGHGGGSRPSKVVVEFLAQPVVAGNASVFQRLIETGDRATVHLLMRAISAVDPHHRGFIPVRGRKRRPPPKRFRPVRGEPLGVIGIKAVAERMAHNFVRHDPGVPRVRQTKQAVITTSGLVNALHLQSIVFTSRTIASVPPHGCRRATGLATSR